MFNRVYITFRTPCLPPPPISPLVQCTPIHCTFYSEDNYYRIVARPMWKWFSHTQSLSVTQSYSRRERPCYHQLKAPKRKKILTDSYTPFFVTLFIQAFSTSFFRVLLESIKLGLLYDWSLQEPTLLLSLSLTLIILSIQVSSSMKDRSMFNRDVKYAFKIIIIYLYKMPYMYLPIYFIIIYKCVHITYCYLYIPHKTVIIFNTYQLPINYRFLPSTQEHTSMYLYLQYE